MALLLTVPTHSLSALRYRLHAGPVDLAPLVIRQEKNFGWESCRVTAFILGASHALTVAFPDGREFTELLTCLPPRRSLPESEGGTEWPVPDSIAAAVNRDFQGGDGVSGSVRLSRFLLVPGADRLSAPFDNEAALHESFPTDTFGEAWTRVGWHIDGPQLRVETIHTYPGDGAGIRSATVLRLRKVR